MVVIRIVKKLCFERTKTCLETIYTFCVRFLSAYYKMWLQKLPKRDKDIFEYYLALAKVWTLDQGVRSGVLDGGARSGQTFKPWTSDKKGGKEWEWGGVKRRRDGGRLKIVLKVKLSFYDWVGFLSWPWHCSLNLHLN